MSLNWLFSFEKGTIYAMKQVSKLLFKRGNQVASLWVEGARLKTDQPWAEQFATALVETASQKRIYKLKSKVKDHDDGSWESSSIPVYLQPGDKGFLEAVAGRWGIIGRHHPFTGIAIATVYEKDESGPKFVTAEEKEALSEKRLRGM